MAVPRLRRFPTCDAVVGGRCTRSAAATASMAGPDGPACVVRAVMAVMAVMAVAAGCAGNQRVMRPGMAAVPPPSLAAPPGVMAPSTPLGAAPPAFAGLPPSPGGDGLSAALERSRNESQLMQDEIVALREQLASTSAQLASVRSTGVPPPPATASAAGVAGAGAITPSTMQSALAGLALPGVEARFDGAVVRIEVPADTLFDGGTANLMPGGAALLTQVAGELGRVYPGHFVGIESHIDTEPLRNASWGSPHQLTAARAAAVFDFLTTRTSLREGQLFLVAHGSNHPVVSNATAAGRAKNRRVELVVYPERTAGD
jgi:flagellar motor protein MotB